MRRNWIYLFVCAAVSAACMGVETDEPSEVLKEGGDDVLMLFGVSEDTTSRTRSVLADSLSFSEDSVYAVSYEDMEPIVWDADTTETTRVTAVTTSNLSSFNLTVVKGSGQTAVSQNVSMTKPSGSSYWQNSGLYWPASDQSYRFYASNVQIGKTSGSYTVSCPADQDVVCAYNGSPTYKSVNSLTFQHVYARIGTITVQPPTGFSGTLKSASMSAPKSGTYILASSDWYSTGSNVSLSLSGSNDVYVVPGTYTLNTTVTVTDGTSTTSSLSRSGSITLVAGKVNNITVKINDKFTYTVEVTPASASVDIGGTQKFLAYYKTYYGTTCIHTAHVTSMGSTTWSSSNTSVATVTTTHTAGTSRGVATGVSAGTATISAKFRNITGSASLTVNDAVSSYGTPTVSLSYSPNPVGVTAGTTVPTCTYSQTVTYQSGRTETITSGATVTYSPQTTLTGWSTASDGTVSYPAYTGSTSRTYTVRATVTMPHGETAYKDCVITQNPDSITGYDNPVVTLSYSPNPVSAASGTTAPTYTAYQTVHYASGRSENVTTGLTYVFSAQTTLTGWSTASNGTVTYPAYSGTASRTYKVRLTVTGQGDKSGYADCTITQDADSVTSYGTPTVTLTYPDSPAAYNSTGAMNPTLVVKQQYTYASGRTENVTLGSDQYTVTYGASSVTGLTLNTVTGAVTPADNTGSSIEAHTDYTDPAVTSFSYGNIAYTGGSSNPSIAYSQTKNVYTAGRASTASRSMTVTATVTANSKTGTGSASVTQNGDSGVAVTHTSSTLTSGASVTYSGTAAGFSIDTDTGVVTAQSNKGTGEVVTYGVPTVTFTAPSTTIAYTGGSITCSAATYVQAKTTSARSATSSRSISVTATVTMNGKSSTGTATCNQGGDEGAAELTENITDGGSVTYTSSGTGFSNSANVITAASNKGADYTDYGDISVVTFSYPAVKAAGGTAEPTLSCARSVTTGRRATSERTGTITATVTMNGKSGSKSLTITQSGDEGTSSVDSETVTGYTKSFSTVTDNGAATLNTTSGAVTWTANTSTTTSRSETERVTVTYLGKTATKTAASVQNKKSSWNAGGEGSGSGGSEGGNY